MAKSRWSIARLSTVSSCHGSIAHDSESSLGSGDSRKEASADRLGEKSRLTWTMESVLVTVGSLGRMAFSLDLGDNDFHCDTENLQVIAHRLGEGKIYGISTFWQNIKKQWRSISTRTGRTAWCKAGPEVTNSRQSWLPRLERHQAFFSLRSGC